MEAIHRFSHRLFPISETLLQNSKPLRFPLTSLHKNPICTPKSFHFRDIRQFHSAPSSKLSPAAASAGGWFSGFGLRKKAATILLPEIVKAGDPVLHEPASEVPIEEIGSERIQKIVEDMIGVMRKAPGVGLAAPQIGIPLRIIVLEDTKEYISYASKNETEAQDRRPFDLMVIINPKLKKKGNKTTLFFEGCLSVDGFRAVVERHLEVEVTGFNRDGNPFKVDATGWHEHILQHECDHLDGTIYVDKFVPRTFRTVENLDLPLPILDLHCSVFASYNKFQTTFVFTNRGFCAYFANWYQSYLPVQDSCW